MHRILKTEAFVLRRKQLLNKDAIIILFTEETGKVAVIAKGIHSITSRRLSSLMTGNLIQVSLTLSKDTYYLQQVKTVSLFSRIKKDASSLRQAYLFFFLVDNLLPERQREDAAYLRIKKIMISLSKASFSPEEERHNCKDFFRLMGYTLHATTSPHLLQEMEEIIGKKIPAIVYN